MAESGWGDADGLDFPGLEDDLGVKHGLQNGGSNAAEDHAAEVVRLREQVLEMGRARESDQEAMEQSKQELCQRTKDHVRQLQEKMQQVMRQKDERIKQLEEAANESQQAQDASAVAGTDSAEKVEQLQLLVREAENRAGRAESRAEEAERTAQESSALREEAERSAQHAADSAREAGEAASRHNAELSAAVKARAEFEARLQELQEQFRAASVEAASLREQLSAGMQQQQDAPASGGEPSKEADELRAELASTAAELAAAREEARAQSSQAAYELRAELASTAAELASAREEVAAQSSQAADELRAELASTTAELAAAREEAGAQSSQAADELRAELASTAAELAAAREEAGAQSSQAADALRAELAGTVAELAAAREEVAAQRSQAEQKLAEIVQKTKEHVKQLQARLEASVAENTDLRARSEEMESQKDTVQRYQTIMSQAKSRLDDHEQRESELREALRKSQAQGVSLQEHMGSMERSCAPPSAADIAARGGISMAAEGDGDDIWCFIPPEAVSDDEAEEAAEETRGEDAAEKQQQPQAPKGSWWLFSQLEGVEKPVPVQRRWRGEVSALKAQLQRFKRRSEEVQEEFDCYKQKAGLALETNASQVELLAQKERELEVLGTKLHSSAAELQRASSDRDRALEDVSEGKRRLQEVFRETRELERSGDRRAHELEAKGEADLLACKQAAQEERGVLETTWRERERNLLKDLDINSAKQAALEDEAASLRDRVVAAETAAAAAAARALAAPLPPPAVPDSVTPRTPPAARGACDGGDPAAVEDQTGGDKNAGGPALPAQAYSLHASVAWQDMVALRSQVRELEAQLFEEAAQANTIRREHETAHSELREITMQQKLTDTVGQHQHMEYIRTVFRRFLEKLPVGAKEQEQLIPVLMTFFKFPDGETKAILGGRPGGGLLGAFGWSRG